MASGKIFWRPKFWRKWGNGYHFTVKCRQKATLWKSELGALQLWYLSYVGSSLHPPMVHGLALVWKRNRRAFYPGRVHCSYSLYQKYKLFIDSYSLLCCYWQGTVLYQLKTRIRNVKGYQKRKSTNGMSSNCQNVTSELGEKEIDELHAELLREVKSPQKIWKLFRNCRKTHMTKGNITFSS